MPERVNITAGTAYRERRRGTRGFTSNYTWRYGAKGIPHAFVYGYAAAGNDEIVGSDADDTAKRNCIHRSRFAPVSGQADRIVEPSVYVYCGEL